MSDLLQATLDMVALGAFVAFTALCFTLTRTMKGSALRRGFLIAGIAGLVHLVGNSFAVLDDLGSSSPIPTDFPIVQVIFAILLAISVRSFFPAWYKAFKRDSGNFLGASPSKGTFPSPNTSRSHDS